MRTGGNRRARARCGAGEKHRLAGSIGVVVMLVAALLGSVVELAPSRVSVAGALPANPSPPPASHQPGDELVELRTEYSRTTLRTGGVRETSISTRPIHYSLAGNWMPIDTSLVRVGPSFVTKANKWKATFAPLPAGVAILDADGAGTISSSPVGAALVMPEADGPSRVIYRDARPGADLRYTVHSNEVKEEIIVRTPQAAGSYTFAATGADLAPDANAPGGFVFTGALARWRVAPPEVLDRDEAPIPKAVSGVRLDLGGDAAARTLTVSVDETWRAGLPESAYPITIDPTHITGSAQTIAYSNDGDSCACGVRVGNQNAYGSWYPTWRTTATFPYDPAYNKEIQGAEVKLWNRQSGQTYGVELYSAGEWDWVTLGPQVGHQAWDTGWGDGGRYWFGGTALRDLYQGVTRPPSGGLALKFKSDAEWPDVNTFGQFQDHELRLFWNDWDPTLAGNPSASPTTVNDGSAVTFSQNYTYNGTSQSVRLHVCDAGGFVGSSSACAGSTVHGPGLAAGQYATGGYTSSGTATAQFSPGPGDSGTSKRYYTRVCSSHQTPRCSDVQTNTDFSVVNRAPTSVSVSRSATDENNSSSNVDPSGEADEGQRLAYQITWNDPGDSAFALLCRNDSTPTLPGPQCSGAPWAQSIATNNGVSKTSFLAASPYGANNFWAWACNPGATCTAAAGNPGTFTVNKKPSNVTLSKTNPAGNATAGSPITFSVGYNDTAGENVKLVLCDTNGPVTPGPSPTCAQNTLASTSTFTTANPAQISYTPTDPAQSSKTFYAAVCDDNDACSQPSSGLTVFINQPPGAVNVTDEPDPVGIGSRVAFTVTFSTNNGQQARALICKTSAAPAAGTCPGDSWGPPGDYSNGTSTAEYATLPTDLGQHGYWAYACDAANSCTPSLQNPATFDVVPPTLPLVSTSQSDRVGFEDFYGYRGFDLGPDQGFVNLSNGDFAVTRHDIALPGQGLGLGVTRTYNASRSALAGPLGPGWAFAPSDLPSSGIGRGTSILATGTMLAFDDADGTRHWFLKDATGWHSPSGVNLTVSDRIEGSSGDRVYDVIRPDGVRWTIARVGAAYHVTRVDDRRGNSLTLGYASDLLSTITDVTGRQLILTWTGGLVTRVRFMPAPGAPDWHDVTFGYTSGRLTSVTDASGTADARTTTYAYTGGVLSSVGDARGNTTSVLYSSGRVSRVTDRAGKAWQLAYNVDDPTGSSPTLNVELKSPDFAITNFVSSAAGNLVLVQDAGDVDEAGNEQRNRNTFAWVDNRLRTKAGQAGTATFYNWNTLGLVTETFTTGGSVPFITRYTWAAAMTPGVADLTDSFTAAGTAEERHQHFDYDQNNKGLVVATVDALGNSTTFGYYVRGLLRSTTDANSRTTTVGHTNLSDGGYDRSGQPTKVTDPTGAFKSFGYDIFGRLNTTTTSTNEVWTQGFDRRGNLTSSATPLGVTGRTCYDANDNPVLVIAPHSPSTSCSLTGTEGYSTRSAFDPRDLLASTTTASKSGSGTQIRKQVYGYFEDGELSEITEPRSFDPTTGTPITPVQKATYARYKNNRVQAFTDEEGKRTDVVYTPDGLPALVTNPPSPDGSRRTERHAYDDLRRHTATIESGHAGATILGYDRHGDVVFEMSPGRVFSTTRWDNAGRRDLSIDAQGRLTDYSYDPVGNLTQLTQPTGIGQSITTTYSYTARNEIDLATDPADPNHVVDYDYDNLGRQTYRRDRSGTSSNLASRPVVRTTATGYDADGRILTKDATYPSSPNGGHKTTFQWNSSDGPLCGNKPCDALKVATASKDGVPAAFSTFVGTYTSAGELESWTETLTNTAGTPVNKTGSYTYQQDGVLASRTIDGNTVTYAHDRRGLPTRATPWGASPNYTWSWSPSGALLVNGLPTGAAINYSYDSAERVKSQSYGAGGTTLASWQNITYDEDDRRLAEDVTQVQANGGGALTGSASYTYDSLGRLRTFKHPFDAAVTPFVMDDAGNVLADGSSVRTYNANRLTSTQSLEPTLEPGPPPVVELPGTTTYNYDQVGNRTADVTAANIVTYNYDAAGHTTTEGGINSTGYRYDFGDRLVYQASNTETRLFFHDGLTGQVAVETDDAGTVKTRYVLDSGGQPLANEDATKPGTTGRGHYILDPRGSVTAVVDGTNNVTATFAYDAFGRGKPTGTSFTSGWDSRLRFQASPRNPSSGSYALGPRIYDPGTSRFVGADSMLWSNNDLSLQSDQLTGNRYLYAGANPVGMVDDGHKPCSKAAKAAKKWASGPGRRYELPEKFCSQSDRSIAAWQTKIFNLEIKIFTGVCTAACRKGLSAMGARASSATGYVWNMGPSPRGFEVERLLGGNLGPNFRTIDRWDRRTGAATSIKSLDYNSTSYQANPDNAYRTIRGYADKVAGFDGASGWNDEDERVNIESRRIKSRVLAVGIPEMAMGDPNAVLQSMMRGFVHAINQGVEVQVELL